MISVSKIAHFTGHNGAVYSLAKSFNPGCIYSGGDDGFVVEWNIHTKADGKLVARLSRPVYTILPDSINQYLYCGTASGNLHVLDLQTGQEIRNLEAHQLGLYSLEQDESFLFSGGGDGYVSIWEKPSLQLKHRISIGEKSARIIRKHPVQQIIAVGSSDFHIRTIEAETGHIQHDWKAHENSVFALAYDEDGSRLYSGGRDAMLRLWDVASNTQLQDAIPAHTLQIKTIQFRPDRKLFATCSMDKSIKIWDPRTLQLLKVIDYTKFQGHQSSVNQLVWVDDQTLASCSDDRTVQVWKVDY